MKPFRILGKTTSSGLLYITAVTMVIAATQNSEALSITLATEFSGAQQPAGTIKLDITAVDADTVNLRVTSQLTPDADEFASDVYLNLNTNPAFDPATLTFSNASVVSGPFALPTITTGLDFISADGSGRYDINLAFTTNNSGGGVNRFNGTDVFSVDISRIGGLTDADFNFISTGGGNGAYVAAAHVQGVGANASGSGFIRPPDSVPDFGATAMLLGLSMGGIGLIRRYIQK